MRIEKNTQSNVMSCVSLLRNTKRNYYRSLNKKCYKFFGKLQNKRFQKNLSVAQK